MGFELNKKIAMKVTKAIKVIVPTPTVGYDSCSSNFERLKPTILVKYTYLAC